MASRRRQVRIEDAAAAVAVLHPTRARVLAELREPASATEVARRLGLPAARVNHHVQRLRTAGLIRRAGSRRVRNLTEILYVSLGHTFTISEALTPGGETRRRFREEGATRPLRNLVALGERLADDSLALLDRAATGDLDVSAFATLLDLRFPDAGARAAFLAELLTAVQSLRRKYGVEDQPDQDDDPIADERYKTVVACYPQPDA
ncbi:MAG TPA: helix-turn-helix domain-containing protein [bacterium]|nr:helix-turn-helix domain-containing protein [bacterium]